MDINIHQDDLKAINTTLADELVTAAAALRSIGAGNSYALSREKKRIEYVQRAIAEAMRVALLNRKEMQT